MTIHLEDDIDIKITQFGDTYTLHIFELHSDKSTAVIMETGDLKELKNIANDILEACRRFENDRT
jgi:hypothetical protein